MTPFQGEESIISERVDDQTKPVVEGDAKSQKSGETHTLVDELSENEILKYQFLSNMALDIFLSPFFEGEQGIPVLLFIQDGINIYGYETNTGLKILIGSSSEIDESFGFIFKKLHRLYLNLIVNPFQSNDLSQLTINEEKTTLKVNQIIDEWDKKYNTE